MINDATINAFGDELEKISGAFSEGAKKWLGTSKQWLSTGWNKPIGMWEKSRHGAGAAGDAAAAAMKGKPLKDAAGKQVWHERPDATWMGQGKITKHLPVGDKGIAAGLTATMIPSTLRKEDDSGMQRSRGERVSGLVGSTLGGFAGMGAMSHLPMKGLGLTRVIAGGVIGGMAGERAATAPFRHMRKAEMPAQQMSQQPQQMGNGVA